MTTDGARTPRPRPVAANVYVVLVVVAAAALLAVETFRQSVGGGDVERFALLAVFAVGYDWTARRIENVRRRTASGPYVTMDSVWVLAAAMNLPVVLTAAVLLLTQAHAQYQGRRDGNAKPVRRVVFNIAASLLPAAVVSEMVSVSGALQPGSWTGSELAAPLVLFAAVAAYMVVNAVLVGGVIALSTGERRPAQLVGSATENLVELATVTLGVLVGVALVLDVWLPLLAVPILALLQRIALVDHLESAASEDSKTGLLNAAAWNHVAERDLERIKAREQQAAVMVLDLDHFKAVNDTYGHLTGDLVLRSVAECMRGMLRDRDQVARFGGEEFVAFLPGADASEAVKVAERLRQRVADSVVAPAGRAHQDGHDGTVTRELVRVTVSIGVAAYPEHGETLEELLARADQALYGAKGAGRNRTHAAAA